MLKVKEVAERVRVDPETVRRWLRSGELRGVLVGPGRGRYRVPESEVNRMLELPERDAAGGDGEEEARP
jgi:excisionase family DNA binding protein